jgi:hypothetical protein
MRRCVIGRRGTVTRNLNRRRAIRHHCRACSNFRWDGVVNCPRQECPLFPFRTGAAGEEGGGAEERKQAISRFCGRCRAAGLQAEDDCDAVECALHTYRK